MLFMDLKKYLFVCYAGTVLQMYISAFVFFFARSFFCFHHCEHSKYVLSVTKSGGSVSVTHGFPSGQHKPKRGGHYCTVNYWRDRWTVCGFPRTHQSRTTLEMVSYCLTHRCGELTVSLLFASSLHASWRCDVPQRREARGGRGFWCLPLSGISGLSVWSHL